MATLDGVLTCLDKILYESAEELSMRERLPHSEVATVLSDDLLGNVEVRVGGGDGDLGMVL